MPASQGPRRASFYRPGRGPLMAGWAAAALFVAGSLAAVAYGLARPEPALRWPTIAGAIAYIVAPICLLILLLAALSERRPPARLVLGLPAFGLALLVVVLGWFAPAESSGATLLCFGPLALIVGLIPLLAWRQTPPYLREARLEGQGERLRAYLSAHDGLARYGAAARALGLTEPALRLLLAELEASGDLAGVHYPQARLFVSAPAEERGVARVEALLAEGAPRDAATLAASLRLPEAVVADWLTRMRARR